MTEDELVEVAARALLEHHFHERSPSEGALERARADARIVINAVNRCLYDDLK